MNTNNSMMVLFPYKANGVWMFSDLKTGLWCEPFVLGIDTMLDIATADIINAQAGFKLMFAPAPFAGYKIKLEWIREELGGHWYECAAYQLCGWLCPAMFRYLPYAPAELYAKPEVHNINLN